jgi:hypothetical protein
VPPDSRRQMTLFVVMLFTAAVSGAPVVASIPTADQNRHKPVKQAVKPLWCYGAKCWWAHKDSNLGPALRAAARRSRAVGTREWSHTAEQGNDPPHLDAAAGPVSQIRLPVRPHAWGAIIPVHRAPSSRNPGRHHLGLTGRLRRKTQIRYAELKRFGVCRLQATGSSVRVCTGKVLSLCLPWWSPAALRARGSFFLISTSGLG